MTFYEINNTRTSKKVFDIMKRQLDLQNKAYDIIKKRDRNNNTYNKLFCTQESEIIAFTNIIEANNKI